MFVIRYFVLIELSLPENLQQIVINQFSRVARHDRCSFFGNVTLGSSVSLLELRELYHVVRMLALHCFTVLEIIYLFIYLFCGKYGSEC